MDTFISFGLLVLILWLGWFRFYGPIRASFAAVLRALWLLPVVLLFFPKPSLNKISSKLSKDNIHVFVDDSFSITKGSKDEKVKSLITHLNTKCKALGCELKITKMSDVFDGTKLGYSQIFDSVKVWLSKTNGEPWIVISDGADSIPKRRWAEELKGSGLNESNEVMGLSIYTGDNKVLNYSLSKRQDTLFGFSGKSLTVPISIQRSSVDSDEVVQIQLSSKSQHLGSENISFNKGDKTVDADIDIESLSKGNHLIKVTLLPVSGEKAIWDNTIYIPVEVMSNTIGVLHILGAPSWDGRYLRRYFKAEPKYDMISFFILRDPSDSQFVKERDLSLIPFPVDRLFTEELKNFSAVVIQNFTLFRFLQRDYQENLVKFVKNGGGLLFMGGRRALTQMDMINSPLAEILPFRTSKRQNRPNINPYSNFYGRRSRNGESYNDELSFNLKPANPTSEQRAIASVYDDFLPIVGNIGKDKKLKGLNIIEGIEIDEENATPLLVADTGTKEYPFALASYPGKGRALWFLSDSIYQLSLNPDDKSSTTLYNQLVSSSMKWLLRKEFEKPLFIDYIEITPETKQTRIRFGLRGSASRFLTEKDRWQLNACSLDVDFAKTEVFNASESNSSVQLIVPTELAPGSVCEIRLEGEHPSFGEIKVGSASLVSLRLKDLNMFSQKKVMKELAIVTGADFLDLSEASYSKINSFIEKWSSDENSLRTKDQEKISEDHYWFLSKSWIYLLLLCLPLEVLLRRWSVLFPSQKFK